ncbi:MAG: FAD-binding oxidoreductase [Nitrolancea sp.]
MVSNAPQRTMISDSDIQSLDNTLRGPLVQPTDRDYAEVCQVWNGMIDKRPALIARCLGTADIVAALQFAREHDLRIAVRGAGHNVAGNALCDDGLVIDLSLMKGIHVDPKDQSARVQPGANWGDVDRETQRVGLATPGGQVSTTGISGFTLAGGMGFLRRKWGLACDNLKSVEVVTATGEVLTACESDHPDLFWAIRGGGGNFGVISSFEFQLHPLGPEIFGAAVVYPGEQTAVILRRWRDYLAQAPDEVTCDALVWGMPPLPMVPEELHWAPVVILVAVYAGPTEAGEQILQPIREFSTPIADLSGPRRYVGMQSELDALFPSGQLYYWKSLFMDELGDDVQSIADLARDRPSPRTLLALRGLGGAMGRVPENATAYAHRTARFNLSIDSTWQDPTMTQTNVEWTRRVWSEMRTRTGGGVYLNFAGLGEDNEMLAHAGYGHNYDRLKEIKRRYDPTNLFRGNINIEP